MSPVGFNSKISQVQNPITDTYDKSYHDFNVELLNDLKYILTFVN